jgi:hypothetical protein
MIQKPYTPIIKVKGFQPAPVAGNIPIWADGKINPRVQDTQKYRDFWDEQFDRCINGYDTGGIHIPGRYYFYINFVVLQGLRGPSYPMYVDLDLEYFNLVEYVKKNQKTGIVSVKARRKGLSEKSEGGILSYGIRFIEGYRGAIAAGLDTYQVGLRKKFDSAQSKFHDELRLNVLKDNDSMYHVGYERKDPIGGFVDDGYGGRLSFATLFDDAKKLEGEYFHDVIFEECGQFKLLGEAFESIKPALEFGILMLGTFYIYGTGGNILSTSKDFKDFWDNAETYGLEKFWIPGTRLYYPFFGNPFDEYFIDEDNSKKIDSIPNLRELKPFQRIGCEDIKAAEQYILAKRVEYAKLPNKKKLKEHNQNYPLTVEEAFTSGGSNNFNDEKIYDRLFTIEGEPNNYRPVVLSWVYDIDDGIKRIREPLQVEHRPAKKGDPDGEIIWVYQMPRIDMTDLDIGGVDSYNQDQTQTLKSLGAMIVTRQGDKVNLVNEGIHRAKYPVCLYYKRPARKEIFFENCLKISVWYNLVKNTMCNAEQDFVIDYFLKNGGRKFLSPRPKAFDAPKSEQRHKFGAKMTGYSKPLILGIVQSWVEDYVQFCQYPELLRDLLAYDEEYIGTDWDSVDALAYSIMRIEDMRTRPRKGESENDPAYAEPKWRFDGDGNAILVPSEQEFVKIDKSRNMEGEGGWKPGDGIDRVEYLEE